MSQSLDTQTLRTRIEENYGGAEALRLTVLIDDMQIAALRGKEGDPVRKAG